ncbi:putative quinol monooxygenase [Planctomicrobium sp. SH527]|uniref:putative quinol monooxygenase n=1 Tax=Planctomicrobium sp. SH527 TaxID=3448123 RepID=UPI003F5C90FE
MVVVNVVLTAKKTDDIPLLKELLAEHGRLSRAEPGCLVFEVCHSRNDPSVFILVERWESEEAIDVHRKAEAYLTIYQPKVIPLVERAPHVSDLVG